MIGLKLLGGICLLVAALRIAIMFHPRAFERSEISRREHAALAFAVLATAADIYTTRRGIDGGCRESNPLYGPYPPTSRLVLIGAVPLAAGYWAADRPGLDVTIGALVLGAWRLRAAWRNSRLSCYG